LGEAPSFFSFFVETERLLFPHLPAFPSASRGPLASRPSSLTDFFFPVVFPSGRIDLAFRNRYSHGQDG
jgi:hypothetical protein